MVIKQPMRRFLHHVDFSLKLLKKQEKYHRLVYNFITRFQSQWSKEEKFGAAASNAVKNASILPARPTHGKQADADSQLSKYSSLKDALANNRWKFELAWLSKTLEPALHLFRRTLPVGDATGKPPPSDRSLVEIVSSIQRSKLGLQDWSLSDLTLGLYLIYLQQASTNAVEDIKGVQVSSDSIVQDLIYHIELAKGSYRDNAAGLARNSMLRESNVVKFVKSSSLLRPGYYIGIDTRHKLVILGIRGTQTVYDLITDVVSSSDEEVTFEGYSTHFGTAEAARWFLNHEIRTIKEYLDKHEGFRVRLVGHSLGGATASLLAIMLRKKSQKELGFSPDLVTAVGYGTPPCVSRELADICSDFVSNVVMQDDIIPRLSVASLTRLRNEILQTDWTSIFEKEEWRSVVDLVTNAKQVVSSVQDVARRVADYTKLGNQKKFSEIPARKDSFAAPDVCPKPEQNQEREDAILSGKDASISAVPEELFVPGTVYYLKRNLDEHKGINYFTLWKRHPGEHFQRILLSSNLISDHKCDSHLYALRDVLKGLPLSAKENNSR